jgi:tRNA(fMet)-specific endonuclease VapC
MERSLLDTDTFSEVLKGRHVAICQKAEAYLSVFGHFTLSVTTVTELIDGFRRKQRDAEITRLLTKFEAEAHDGLVLDLDAAKIAGYVFGDLHRGGKPIGKADPFIAAIALREEIPLVTGNLERIVALGYPLRLENWRGA